MSFDRTLGDIQIASDLGVVASLEQKVNNLPLSGPHGAGDLLHKLAPHKSRAGCRKWRDSDPDATELTSLCLNECACARPIVRGRVKEM
jgi:hypothetical protein